MQVFNATGLLPLVEVSPSAPPTLTAPTAPANSLQAVATIRTSDGLSVGGVELGDLKRGVDNKGSIPIPVNITMSSAVLDQKTEVLGCVNALFTLLESYGLTPRGTKGPQGSRVDRSYLTTTNHWVERSNELGIGGWMKYAKWKFAAFFHSRTRQLAAAPKCPNTRPEEPKFLCGGIGGRYIERILRSPQRDSFLASVLQLKKGCPRPGKAELAESLSKTFKALTDDRKLPDPGVEVVGEQLIEEKEVLRDMPASVQTVLNRHSVEGELRRTVRELFGKQDFGDYMKARKRSIFFPSISASIASSRADGGAYATLQQFAEFKGYTTYKHGVAVGPSLVGFKSVRGEEYIGAPREEWVADYSDLEAVFDNFVKDCEEVVNWREK